MKKITEKYIQRAEKAGACQEALRWLRLKPRTVDELVGHKKAWGWWVVYNLLSKRTIERTIRNYDNKCIKFAKAYNGRRGPSTKLRAKWLADYIKAAMR